MMPIDYRQYAPNWKEISKRIRERDGNRCLFCGVKNHHWIHRHKVTDEWVYHLDLQELSWEQQCAYNDYVLVVLTVAHLDHDVSNNSDNNLAALCQKCHLNYDHEHHMANAKNTRARKKRAKIAENGQLELL